jgi:lipid-binding SYLF domain-containing protein
MRAVYIEGCISIWHLTTASSGYASTQEDVDQAATIIERFQAVPKKAIPQAVLRDARGLALMTVIKAGFGFSRRGGSGIVVARTRNGWSGPSAIGTGGVGFGLQIEAEMTGFVMVLNTDAAVDAFSRDVNITLGGDISVAAGLIWPPFTRIAGVIPFL